jgi:CHAD domain-containing protein
MPLDLKRQRPIFRDLYRQLNRLEKKLAPRDLHRFRTRSRRLEVLVSEVIGPHDRNTRRLAKMLGQLRKKAGAARDLDVQIALLRNLRVPQDATRKSELLESLLDERSRRERKVSRAFDRKTVRELRRRLKRAVRELAQRSERAEPWHLAMLRAAELRRRHAPISEKRLHWYRVEGKRIRYLAEFAGQQDGARILVQRLKRMQDVIGDWHDWFKLAETAERLFVGARGSILLTVLENVTRAKFREACNILAETRVTLNPKPAESAPLRRSPVPASRPTKTAA